MPPPDPVAAMPSAGAVADELARLRELLEQKLLRDQSLQEVVGTLHGALVEAQADLALKFLRPLFLELIGMHDSLAAAAGAGGPAAKALEEARQEVEDLLYRQGVEPYQCPGDKVDPTRQRVKRTEKAVDPGDAGRLAARLRPGFCYLGKVDLRPEEIAAYAKPPS